MSNLTILIADDHPLVLAGIRRTLEQDEGFEVVGETDQGTEVLPLVGQLSPDVVLLDMRMPRIGGLTCLDRIRKLYPQTKIVMCSMSAEPEEVQEAFRRGAAGYIVKNVNPRDLASAIRQAVDGTVFHALGLPAISEDSIARSSGLTPRELEIVKALGRGLSNKAIAKELWIAEQTVKFHLVNIFRKLGVSNRTEAARWALSRGLQDQPDEPALRSAPASQLVASTPFAGAA
jgi:two-component system, NarL family, nitrate/nitrite response regulator NarL